MLTVAVYDTAAFVTGTGSTARVANEPALKALALTRSRSAIFAEPVKLKWRVSGTVTELRATRVGDAAVATARARSKAVCKSIG